MSHFNDYEADQSRLYNIHHHEDINSAESKAKVKAIWKITGILTIITIGEVNGMIENQKATGPSGLLITN